MFADIENKMNTRFNNDSDSDMVGNWLEYLETLDGRDCLIGLHKGNKNPIEKHRAHGNTCEMTREHSEQHMGTGMSCDRCKGRGKMYNLQNGECNVGVLTEKMFVFDFDGPKHQTEANRNCIVNELMVMLYMDIAKVGEDDDIGCPDDNYKKLHEFLHMMKIPRELTRHGVHHFYELPDGGTYSCTNHEINRTTSGIKASVKIDNNRVVALLQYPSLEVISERQPLLDALFLLWEGENAPEWALFEPGLHVTEEMVRDMHRTMGAKNGAVVGHKRDHAGDRFQPFSIPIDFLTKTGSGTRGVVAVAPSDGKTMLLAPWDLNLTEHKDTNHILSDDNPMVAVLEMVTWSGTKKGTKGGSRSRSPSSTTETTNPELVACLEKLLRAEQFNGEFRVVMLHVGRGGGLMSFKFTDGRCPLCAKGEHTSNCWYISWSHTKDTLSVKNHSTHCEPREIAMPDEFHELITDDVAFMDTVDIIRCDNDAEDETEVCSELDEMEEALSEHPETFKMDNYAKTTQLFDLEVKQKLNKMLWNLNKHHDDVICKALLTKQNEERDRARAESRAPNEHVKLSNDDIDLIYNDPSDMARRMTQKFTEQIFEMMQLIDRYIIHVKDQTELTCFKVTRGKHNQIVDSVAYKDTLVLATQVFKCFAKFPVHIDSFAKGENGETIIVFDKRALSSMTLYDFWSGSPWSTLKEDIYNIPHFVNTYNSPFDNGNPNDFNQFKKPLIWDIALNRPEAFDYNIIKDQLDAVLNVGCSGSQCDFDNLIACFAHLIQNLMRPKEGLTFEQRIDEILLRQIILIVGEEGTGKTLIFRDLMLKAFKMGSLTHENVMMKHYCGAFNEGMEGKVFGFADEIGKTGKGKAESADMGDNLKRIQTCTYRPFEMKGKGVRLVPNLMNVFACAENTEEITLFEPGSRRIFTIHTNTSRKQDEEFWASIVEPARRDAYSVTLIRYLLQFKHPTNPNWKPGNLTSQGCVQEYTKRLSNESYSIRFIAEKLVQNDEYKAEFHVGNDPNNVTVQVGEAQPVTFTFSFVTDDSYTLANYINPSKLKQCIQHFKMEDQGTKVGIVQPCQKEFNEMRNLFEIGQAKNKHNPRTMKSEKLMLVPTKQRLLEILERKYKFII